MLTNQKPFSPASRRTSPDRISQNQSIFNYNSSAGSGFTQKIIAVDGKKLKRINDNLGQLCKELDIDDADIDIPYHKPVSSLLLDN